MPVPSIFAGKPVCHRCAVLAISACHFEDSHSPTFGNSGQPLSILEHTSSELENLTLPKITCDLLRKVHPHVLDRRIQFVEETLTYFVGGMRVPVSVTCLVHFFAQPFDADKVIRLFRRCATVATGLGRSTWSLIMDLRGL